MTPSERERRLQAMIDSLAQHVGAGFWEDGWGQRRVAEMLDAADEAVPLVSEAEARYLREQNDGLALAVEMVGEAQRQAEAENAGLRERIARLEAAAYRATARLAAVLDEGDK